MIVNVSEIADEGMSLSFERDPKWLRGSGDGSAPADPVSVSSDMKFRLDLRRTANEIKVSGEIGFAIAAPCSLCLGDVSAEMNLDVNLLLSSSLPPDRMSSDGETDCETYEGDKVDLGDYLRERVNVSLPYKVVCGEDGRGLCCVCGNNLNESECGFETGGGDSRIAALRDLRI